MTRLRSLLLIAGMCLAFGIRAQLSAYVETKTFYDRERGPIVDVNMAVVGGSSVESPNAHGFLQARIEAISIVSKGDEVVDYRKTEILGPEHVDTLSRDFLHQEHFDLKAGEYDLEVVLKDLNSPVDAPPATFKGPLVVSGQQDRAFFSDVLLIEPPMDPSAPLVPYLSTYFPTGVKTLAFHVQLYNADRAFGADSLFLLSYKILRHEDRKVAGPYQKLSRAQARPGQQITAQFDISSLPSGNYLLRFEAADKGGTVVAERELFFQRNNPVQYDLGDLASVNTQGSFVDAYSDADTLAESIRSLRPIASDLERKIIDDRWKDRDMALMKSFFYSFWYNRNGYDPEGAWKRYEATVNEVNRLYGCRIKAGYDTDRGYVHLKYGPPNTIMDQANDAAGYPYQIWHYYRVGKYSDKRFVFYLPDRVTGCYELLHSEVPGEIKTPNWNQILHATNTPLNNVQSTSVPLGHGEQVQDFYNMPR